MKLTEEMVGQIHDVEKLKYLLIRLIQKKTSQSKKNAIQKKQLRDLRSKLKASTEEAKKLRQITDANNLHQYDSSFERIRADFNEFYFSQLFQLIQGTSPSLVPDLISTQVQSFNANLSKVSELQQNHYTNLISQKNEEIDDLNHKLDALTDQLNTAMNSPISQDIEKLITEKDSAIIKMKSMLQSSVRSDQRKQIQIEELQTEIQRLNDLVFSQKMTKNGSTSTSSASSTLASTLAAATSSSFTNSSFKELNTSTMSNSVDEYARLERTIAELEERIANSSASKELEAKNERLNAMIEKSNQLYSQANDTIRKLTKNLVHDKSYLKVSFSMCFEVGNNLKGNYYHHQKQHEKAKTKKLKRTFRAVIASLRQTLLQFFLKDEANQVELVPVILELVGCNKQQVDTVMLKIQSSQHIVNRTGGFFGIFG